MPTKEAGAHWHPTRARILELIKTAPSTRSFLIRTTEVQRGEIAYHCRALCHSGCIKHAPSSGPDADDPLYLLA